MADLTAIILTMNESRNIENCIQSIRSIAKRIVVIDSGSSDDTAFKAKSLGAEVYEHQFKDHASQFNWALENTDITTTWVLRIDADERFSENLCKEAEQAMKVHENDLVNGMIIRLRVFFLDRWIRHGGVYPFRKLLLFKFGVGRSENRKMDEHIVLDHGNVIELKNDAFHYDFKNLTFWISKHNWYATKEMQQYCEQDIELSISKLSQEHLQNKRRQKSAYYRLPIFSRPFMLFVYRYFLQLGFLDGREGLIYHVLQCFWYRFLVDAKIYEHEKSESVLEETGALED